MFFDPNERVPQTIFILHLDEEFPNSVPCAAPSSIRSVGPHIVSTSQGLNLIEVQRVVSCNIVSSYVNHTLESYLFEIRTVRWNLGVGNNQEFFLEEGGSLARSVLMCFFFFFLIFLRVGVQNRENCRF